MLLRSFLQDRCHPRLVLFMFNHFHSIGVSFCCYKKDVSVLSFFKFCNFKLFPANDWRPQPSDIEVDGALPNLFPTIMKDLLQLLERLSLDEVASRVGLSSDNKQTSLVKDHLKCS
jgi:hypothetical protein